MISSRWGVAALGAAGALFAMYPILRPYAEDEITMAGAASWASPAWLISHMFGIVAFILLAPGLLVWQRQAVPGFSDGAGRSDAGQAGRVGGAARATVALAWLGSVLVLPYYGAETFALGAAGEHALTVGDVEVLAAVESFRLAPVPMTMFGVGLLALAGAGIALIVSTRPGAGLARWGGLLAGLGLATYLPQFFVPAAGRIGHGLVLGIGLVLLGMSLFGRTAHSGRIRRFAVGVGPTRRPASTGPR
ncbi:hypothetical protein [Pseudactinotalea sp. Z1732]|uniref:hypothetical protein n=2 Tax=Micrococcales TaxID=85006 RepID=UPI003C797EC1